MPPCQEFISEIKKNFMALRDFGKVSKTKSSNHFHRVSNMRVCSQPFMTIQAKVVQAWQRLTQRQRQILRHKSMRSGVAVCRFRCKIVLGLVQGKTPSQWVAGDLGSASQGLSGRMTTLRVYSCP